MEQFESIARCPVCEKAVFIAFLACTDHTVSKQDFSIVECDSCRFRFTNPRPFREDISRYYESEEYISHSGTKKGLINFMYHLVRHHTLLKKLKLVSGLAGKGTLLDIGCGTGEFLNVCKRVGWEVCGIEPGIKAREFAAKTYGIDVMDEGSLPDLQHGTFDVITLWHVLEHVHELNERVKQISGLLKKDGYIVIAVPNNASYDAKHYARHWAAYDVPRHLYHFTPGTMRRLMEKHGLKVIRKLPMPFDAFYVSMLSEQYRNGKGISAIIAGLYRGLVSNLSAATGRTGYSSQIYLVSR